MSESEDNMNEILASLTTPFFSAGTTPVHVATCCNRLYAGASPPQTCRGCGKAPASVAFSSPDQVDPEKIP